MNITVDSSIQHYQLSITAFVKTGPLNVHFVSVFWFLLFYPSFIVKTLSEMISPYLSKLLAQKNVLTITEQQLS